MVENLHHGCGRLPRGQRRGLRSQRARRAAVRRRAGSRCSGRSGIGGCSGWGRTGSRGGGPRLSRSPPRSRGRVFFFQAEDGIRDDKVTGVQTCALPIYPPDREELLLSLETYLQAKRNIDVALAGLVDPATGLHTRPALARRARELGALMSRARGGLEIGRASCRGRV